MSSETLPVVFQAAKMAKYTNYQRTCDILFAVFTLTWIVSRIGVFPSHILYSTTIEAPQVRDSKFSQDFSSQQICVSGIQLVSEHCRVGRIIELVKYFFFDKTFKLFRSDLA